MIALKGVCVYWGLGIFNPLNGSCLPLNPTNLDPVMGITVCCPPKCKGHFGIWGRRCCGTGVIGTGFADFCCGAGVIGSRGMGVIGTVAFDMSGALVIEACCSARLFASILPSLLRGLLGKLPPMDCVIFSSGDLFNQSTKIFLFIFPS